MRRAMPPVDGLAIYLCASHQWRYETPELFSNELMWLELEIVKSLTALRAGLAQLVVHLICNQGVGGSNPSAGTIYF